MTTQTLDLAARNERPMPPQSAVPALRIGRHTLGSPVVLAPMAGITNRAFRRLCRGCEGILVSSADARRDLAAFDAASADRAHVLHFVPVVPPPETLPGRAELEARFGFSGPYLYLPNQFWRHKNHPIVIEALAILKQQGVNVVVVASGSAEEPRKTDYFSGLMRDVAAGGLEDNFRYLGLIPLPHVYALLRSSIALINPSRFEGWSTTVEEAKSFGVPMILSDIPVHREQAGASARYFDVEDARGLAGHIAAVSKEKPAAVRDLLPDLDDRVASFAADFVAAVEKCDGRRIR